LRFRSEDWCCKDIIVGPKEYVEIIKKSPGYVQTCPVAHTASCTLGIGYPFRG
jgi:hypothetical protein